MKKTPVLIDTDPGVDDTYALLLAHLSSNIEVKAITVSAGNVGLKYTLKNALGLCDALAWEVPVYKGADKPLKISLEDAEDIHGQNGLCGFEYKNVLKKSEDLSAVDAIYKTAKEYASELVVISLAPPTNIAMALLKYPELKTLIKELVIMGGSTDKGNVTPYAEFNFWCDPDAAKILLESGIETKLIGLNVTMKALLTADDIDSIKSENKQINDMMKKVNTFYYHSYDEDKNVKLYHIPDAVAIFAAINPNGFEYKKMNVTCETAQNEYRGMCKIFEDSPNINVAIEVDSDKFKAQMKKIK